MWTRICMYLPGVRLKTYQSVHWLTFGWKIAPIPWPDMIIEAAISAWWLKHRLAMAAFLLLGEVMHCSLKNCLTKILHFRHFHFLVPLSARNSFMKINLAALLDCYWRTRAVTVEAHGQPSCHSLTSHVKKSKYSVHEVQYPWHASVCLIVSKFSDGIRASRFHPIWSASQASPITTYGTRKWERTACLQIHKFRTLRVANGEAISPNVFVITSSSTDLLRRESLLLPFTTYDRIVSSHPSDRSSVCRSCNEVISRARADWVPRAEPLISSWDFKHRLSDLLHRTLNVQVINV